MAKSLEEAQHSMEKLGKKSGKASTQKVDVAASKLESATQQWDSQAPYIFESLQALDESRVNQLRDALTQYQTHETDCAQRDQETAAEVLAQVIEVSTEAEILGYSSRVTAGRTRAPTRESTRRSSNAETQNSNAPPSRGGSATPVPPSTAQPPPTEVQLVQPAEQPTPVVPQARQEPMVEPKPGENIASHPSNLRARTNPCRIQTTPPRYHLWRWTSTTECPWRLICLWASVRQRSTRGLSTRIRR